MNHAIINEALRVVIDGQAILAGSKWVNCNPFIGGSRGTRHCSMTPFQEPIRKIGILDAAKVAHLVLCVFLNEANKLTGTRHSSIPTWNDQLGRTREQVEEVYRRTIERLRNAVPMGE